MNSKITFPELIELLAAATNTSKRMSELFLKELFATVSQTLIAGESVRIKNLGLFKIEEVKPRKSVSVHTGQEVEIPSHNRLVFTPAKALADAVNEPFAQFETVVLSDDITDEQLDAITGDVVQPVEEDVVQPVKEETPQETAAPEPQEAPADMPATTFIAPVMAPVDTPVQEVHDREETPEQPDASPAPVVPEEPVAQPVVEAPAVQEEPVVEAPAEQEEPVAEAPVVQPVAETPAEQEEPVAVAPVAQPVVDEVPVVQEDEVLPDEELEITKRDIARKSMLRGLLYGALGMLALLGIAWGVYHLVTHKGEEKPATAQTESRDKDEMSTSEQVMRADIERGAGSYGTTQQDEKVEAQPQPEPQEQPVVQEKPVEAKVVTDTVTQTMYLTRMAKKHYGNRDFWVYIYEENKAIIDNPNRITPGTIVVVPPAAKYGIDNNNPESLAKAKAKSTELFARYMDVTPPVQHKARKARKR